MPIDYEEVALYAWCRHTEGKSTKETVTKWNKAFPKRMIKEKDVDDFLSYMVSAYGEGVKPHLARESYIESVTTRKVSAKTPVEPPVVQPPVVHEAPQKAEGVVDRVKDKLSIRKKVK